MVSADRRVEAARHAVRTLVSHELRAMALVSARAYALELVDFIFGGRCRPAGEPSGRIKELLLKAVNEAVQSHFSSTNSEPARSILVRAQAV